MGNAKSLPVLMYHYISKYKNPISVSPELFEEHCKALAKSGWRGVSLAEADAFFLRTGTLPKKSCLITMDDGYLDNYVYAWPILEKYGHKGVIFAVSDRIEEEDHERPTVRDVWEKHISNEQLPRVDEPFVTMPQGYQVRKDLFFSWKEARRMEQSGVISVAAHSLSHQSVFVNDTYTNFLLPGDRKRTFDRTKGAFWGQPMFPQSAGLANRAFLPSEKLTAAIKNIVPQNEEEAFHFASDPKNVEKLHQCVKNHAENLGHYEDDDTMEARMRFELGTGKERMEIGLGHAVTSLCWPWGAFNELSLRIGQELGFTTFYTTRSAASKPGQATDICRFKAKAREIEWLLSRVWLYSRPIIGNIYGRCRL